MTRYQYMSEMQLLCFRAIQALRVLKLKHLENFYSAAEAGFSEKDDLPYEEAAIEVSENELEGLLSLQDFVEERETQAAYKLRDEAEAGNEKQ